MDVRPLLLAALLGLTACSKACRPEGEGGAASAPATRPTSAVALTASDDPKAFFDGLRAQFRDPSAAMPFPADARELLTAIAPIPANVLRNVAANAPVRTLYLVDGEVIRQVTATRITAGSDPEKPLGPDVTLVAGGPDGSRWVGAAPRGSDLAIALFGSTLVVGENATVTRAAGRYLESVALREPSGEGFAVEVFGPALRGPVRARLESTLDALASEAIASARAERARHESTAFLGDPERLVELTRERVRHYLAYLPDLTGLELRVLAGSAGVVLAGRATVTPDSPLAGALASIEVGPPFGFDALPTATALAIATRRARGETPVIELLAPVAGPRLPADARAGLSADADTLAAMRGGASVFALGGHAEGPFALFAAESGATPLDPAVLAHALGVGYVRGLAGGLVGCPETAAPEFVEGRSRLCAIPEGPAPELSLSRGPDGSALVLAAKPPGVTVPHAAGRALVDRANAARGLFGEPDAARALTALGNQTFFAVALGPRGLVPSLGLLGSPRLRSFAGSRALPTSGAPMAFALSRNADGSIGVSATAAPRSIEEAYSLVRLAMLFAGPE